MIIEFYSFGRMTIQGHTYTSDLKIIRGEIHPNWWRKEGHSLCLEDIKDITEAMPELLIVGLGAYGVMKIPSMVMEELNSLGIECRAFPTAKAVKVFNQLFKELGKDQVSGAFHLTC